MKKQFNEIIYFLKPKEKNKKFLKDNFVFLEKEKDFVPFIEAIIEESKQPNKLLTFKGLMNLLLLKYEKQQLNYYKQVQVETFINKQKE